MTKEERDRHRKLITGYGRAELMRLLFDAWRELDAIDEMRGAPFPDGKGQPAPVQDGSALPAQAERGLAARVESSRGSAYSEPVAHTPSGERRDG
jgi:hypothetical protein